MGPSSGSEQLHRVVLTLPNIGEEDNAWVDIAGLTMARLFGEAQGHEAVFLELDETTGEAVFRITVVIVAFAPTINASVQSVLVNLMMLLVSGTLNENVTVEIDGTPLSF
jgi:hypothetical protein